MSSRALKFELSISMFLTASSRLLDAVAIFVFLGEFSDLTDGLVRSEISKVQRLSSSSGVRGFYLAVISVVLCCCLA